MILAKDVVQYCEKEVEKTKADITKVSDHFKALVSPPVFSSINKTIEANEKSRINKLT